MTFISIYITKSKTKKPQRLNCGFLYFTILKILVTLFAQNTKVLNFDLIGLIRNSSFKT
ncbi:hypothetical protein HMP0015_0961 [Acinetobacter haemolyticus ATCC 19194]|uniref:Uncharacterized protein n=1 Tax=Acinetobacter haemolyticus ATCC 19194 TaxID=707232 RepID=D4XMP1_ACIHA|nr:hypothetical protein HMP0015_0961 [Acinetobacter haemolyticus ATCC 19194]